MANTKEDAGKKVKGERSAKIVWIMGALMFGVYAVVTFCSIGNPGEDTLDCLKNGINICLYFLAFTVGNIYLFGRKQEKTAFIGAVIYMVACAFDLLMDFVGGGSLSADVLTTQILRILVYVIFALFAGIAAQGPSSAAFSGWMKLWYLPAALLLLVGLIGSLWTELVRPAGFLWDGFFVDFTLAVILVLPVYTMSRVIRGRTSI